MTKALENRSLDRAISLLEVLAREAPCSLHQLHQRTALPKSTIRRLMGTLVRRHLVRVGISDGLFRPNVALPWSVDRANAAQIGRLVEIALPHMVDLTRRVEWPSDLHVHMAGRMCIVESTYSLSPFRLGERAMVDLQVNLFAAASGLAYLAQLDDAQVRSLVRSNRDDPLWGLDRIGVTEQSLLSELATIRQVGYAFRRPGFNRSAVSRPYNAMAAPVSDAAGVAGALTLFWPKSYMTDDRFAQTHAEDLCRTARAISDDLAGRA